MCERCFELISLDLDTTKKFRLPLCEFSNDILFTITLKIYLEVRFIKFSEFHFLDILVSRSESKQKTKLLIELLYHKLLKLVTLLDTKARK